MNKKTFFPLVFVSVVSFFICCVATAMASTTPTPTNSPSLLDQEINSLKDKIASKVAELRLVERRGIFGTVSNVTNSQITITDPKDATRYIDVDELTKFSSPSAKGSFGISDIVKGNTIGALGLYNKQSQRLLARFVDVIIAPQIFHGTVITADKSAFTISIATDNKKQYLADVEDVTKTLLYTKDAGLVRAGFSKITNNEHIIVIGFLNKQDPTHITATRILLFPDIPMNPAISVPTEEPSLTPPSPAPTVSIKSTAQ